MARDPRFEIVGVIDRQKERADAVAAQFGIARSAVTADLKDVPWLDEIDALTVSTSPFTHYSLIKAALEAGKHVLTEKPFTLSVAEGQELVELSQAQSKTLAIVHNFQFARSFLKLQRDIARGKLGAITSVQAIQFSNPRRRLPVWYDELPLGLFFDESPHLLYLLRALLPEGLQLCAAHAHFDHLNTPTLLSASFEGRRGGKTVPVSMQLNFVASLSEWQIVVFGTKRCGMVDIFRDIYLCLPNDGLHTTKTVVRTSLAATAQHFGAHFQSGIAHLRGELFYGNETVFARFGQAVASGQAPRGIAASDALAVLKMQHQIMETVAPETVAAERAKAGSRSGEAQ